MDSSIHIVIIHARIINNLIIVVHTLNNNSINIKSTLDKAHGAPFTLLLFSLDQHKHQSPY